MRTLSADVIQPLDRGGRGREGEGERGEGEGEWVREKREDGGERERSERGEEERVKEKREGGRGREEGEREGRERGEGEEQGKKPVQSTTDPNLYTPIPHTPIPPYPHTCMPNSHSRISLPSPEPPLTPPTCTKNNQLPRAELEPTTSCILH